MWITANVRWTREMSSLKNNNSYYLLNIYYGQILFYPFISPQGTDTADRVLLAPWLYELGNSTKSFLCLIYFVGFFWFAVPSKSACILCSLLSPFHLLIFFSAVHYNIPCLCNASWNQKETESDQDDEVIWILLLLFCQR